MRPFPLVAALATTLLFTPLHAATVSRPSLADHAADRSAVDNFRFTESLYQHSHAFVLDVDKQASCSAYRAWQRSVMSFAGGRVSLDQASTMLDGSPTLHALLAKHDLTARDAIIGAVELMRTKFKMMDPAFKRLGAVDDSPVRPESAAQRANDAFMAAHQQEEQQFNAATMAAGIAGHHGPMGMIACMRGGSAAG